MGESQLPVSVVRPGVFLWELAVLDIEKKEMLASLESGRGELLAALRGVTEEQAVRRPGPNRWSVLECVEHVALAEDFLFARILASEAVGSPVVNQRREAKIPKRGLDRSFKIEAPDPARPTGRFPTLAAAVAHFVESRDRTIQYVEACTEDLRARLTTHPLIGTVNCWENLLMIAMHPHRHAAQIREVKMDQAFPPGDPAP